MQPLTLLSALAATAAALPAAMPVPAGGPQGPISYPVGTVVQIATLQPSANWYLASHYATNATDNAAYIEAGSADTTPPLNFVTTNVTDAAGYTGVAMQAPGYGLAFTDHGIIVEKDADMGLFNLRGGILGNTEAPEGFYYCDSYSPDLDVPFVGRTSFVVGGHVPEECYAAAFVALNPPVA